MSWVYDEKTNQMKMVHDKEQRWVYDESKNQMVVNPKYNTQSKESGSNTQTSFKNEDGVTSLSRKMGNADGNRGFSNKSKSATASIAANNLGNLFGVYDTTKQNFFDYLDTINPKVNSNYDQFSKDKMDLLYKQNMDYDIDSMQYPSSAKIADSRAPLNQNFDFTQPNPNLSLKDNNSEKDILIQKAKDKMYESEIHNEINWDGTLTKGLKDYAGVEREKVYEGVNNPLMRGALDLGFTIADQAPGYALSAVNPALGSVYFGLNAAGNQMYDVSNRGVTADKALASGIASGLIESATEALPLSMFSDTLKVGGKLGTNITRQALTEGAEEGLSYMLGNLAENQMLGDKANKFSNEELLQNVLMGGLTGGVFGGIGTTVGNVKQNKILNKNAKTDIDLQNKISLAESIKENAFDEFEANKMQSIIDQSKEQLDESLLAKEKERENYVASRINSYESSGYTEAEIDEKLAQDLSKYDRVQGNYVAKGMVSTDPIINMESHRENTKTVNETGKKYNVSSQDIKLIEEVANGLNIAVRFEDASKMPNANAEGYYRNGEVVISNQTKNPILQVFSHEITHHAENSLWYNDYVSVAADMISKEGRNFEAMKQEIIESYANSNVELTDQEAMHEVMATFTQNLIQNEKDLTQLVRSNRNVAQRILNWVKVQLSKFSKNSDLIRARDILSKALNTAEAVDSGKEQFILGKIDNSEYPLDTDYSEEEINRLHLNKNKFIEGIDYSVDEFVSKYKNSGVEKRLILGKLPNDLINRIESDTGINLNGYVLSLSSNGLTHSLQNHGIEAKHYNPKSIEIEDIKRLPHIINEYDEVSLNSFKAPGGLQTRLVFKTDTEHGYGYKTIELKASKGRELSFYNMYTYKKGTSPVADANKLAPTSTSKDGSRVVPTLNVRQDIEYVNNVENKRNNTNELVSNETVASSIASTQNIEQDVDNVNDTNKYSLGLTLDDIDPSRKNDLTKRVSGYRQIKKNTMENLIENADSYNGQKMSEYIDEATKEILATGTLSKETKKMIADEFINNSQNFVGDQTIKTTDTGEAMINHIKELLYDYLKEFEYQIDYKSNQKVYRRYIKKLEQEGTVYNKALSTLSNVTADTKELNEIREQMQKENIKIMPAISDIAPIMRNYGAASKTISQNLDYVADGDAELRRKLYEVYEKPLHDAKKLMIESKKLNINKIYKQIQKELGIKKGSKEDSAIMWYGEGSRMKRDRRGNPIYLDVKTVDTEVYSLADLRREFPDTWSNVVKAEKIFRDMYDEYFERVNGMYETIWSNDELQAEELEKKANIQRDLNSARIQLKEIVEAGSKGLGTSNSQAVVEALDRKIVRLSKEFNNVKDDVYRNKRLTKREDYFHHMKEESTAEKFSNFFNQDNQMNISNSLSGISEFTKPKTKWQGWMQRRGKGKYSESTITSALNYIDSAEYSIAIDPLINYYRNITKQLVKASDEAGVNNGTFLNWFTNYTNDLAGKTNPFDRWLANTQSGRKSLYFLGKLNGLVKKNAILGNINSMFSQFFNLPNAVGLLSHNGGVQSSIDWKNGARDYTVMIQSKLSGDFDNNIINQSTFMQERYMDGIYDQFDSGFVKSTEKMMKWMLTVGDQSASELTWYAAYNQGLRKNVDNAIEYADDITRRAVAGRGIGEVPLTQKSKLVQLVAPFQVEVNNAYQLLKRMGGSEKDLASVFAIFLSTWLMNQAFENITGNRVGMDIIDALIDSWKISESKDEKALQKVFSMGGRFAGEVLSNVPMGAQIVDQLGFDDYTKEKFFGESDPTRFGTGNIGLKSVFNPIGQLFTGKDVDWSGTIANFLPSGGGKQLDRTFKWMEDAGLAPRIDFNTEEGLTITNPKKGAYNQKNELKYAVELDEPIDVLKGAAFGTYQTKYGKDYLDENRTPLSVNKSKGVEELTSLGVDFGDAYETMREVNKIEGVSGKDNSKGILSREHLDNLGLWNKIMGNEWLAEQYGINPAVATMPEKEYNYKLNNGFGSAIDVKKSEKLSNMASDFGLSGDTVYGAYEATKKIGALQNSKGKTIKYSQDALQRQYLESLDLWDEVRQDEELASVFGIDPTVFKWSQQKYEEFLRGIGH